MKKLLLFLLIIQNSWINAQLSDGGLPVSYKTRLQKKSLILPEFRLHELNSNKLIQEDSINNIQNRYSEFEDVKIDLKEGVNTTFENENGQIWQYKIVSEEAKSIQIIFSKFYIPSGAKLFIYNIDYSLIFGAYTNQNNREDSLFVVGDFASDELIVEYFEPFNAAFKGEVVIGSIGQAYKNIFSKEMDENGYIDINCSEGKDWQKEKHAVCKITFKIGLSGYLCSGSLINNAKQDAKPYFLTANHCIDDTMVAKTVVAYFNFEIEGCNGDILNTKSLAGARLQTRGEESDFCLLLLSQKPAPSLLPYYAGWDISEAAPIGGVSIHHPEGTIKKISKDFDAITSNTSLIKWDEGDPSPPETHWESVLDIGNIAGGSSGAPFFSSKKRIIGQLHGGTENEKYFGKLSYSYTHSELGLKTLKTFLDPDNTGIQYLDGLSPGTNPPDAFYTSDFTKVCTGSQIQFTDYSAFSPSTWNWTFNPATVSFAGGTNASSKNPKIIFNQPGNYDVTLSVTNTNGTDQLFIDTLVHAGSEIEVGISRPFNNMECLCDFDSLLVEANGATTYGWSFIPDIAPYFESYKPANNMDILKLKPGAVIDSSLNFNIIITGQHGTCSDSLIYPYQVLKQVNDEVSNALPLQLGVNGPFTNLCATIETGEPVPPYTSCTGQLSWCDEYSNGLNIVENSVWFYFNPPATGFAGMRSADFDNQLAIYEAETYQDILSGNATLLGANDDFTDFDYNPIVKRITVNPAKKYWVQVDGSGGGTEGEFYLYLYDDAVSGIHEPIVNNGLKFYPQPATNLLTVESEEFISESMISIDLFSLDGRKLFGGLLNKSSEVTIQVPTGFLHKGVYIIRINVDGKIMTGKFIR